VSIKITRLRTITWGKIKTVFNEYCLKECINLKITTHSFTGSKVQEPPTNLQYWRVSKIEDYRLKN
jgi:hypothetical protein